MDRKRDDMSATGQNTIRREKAYSREQTVVAVAEHDLQRTLAQYPMSRLVKLARSFKAD